MPLFVDQRTGEGVHVDCAPHQPSGRRAAKHLRRLAQSCIWLDYYRKGLSTTDIADLAGVELRAVQRGLDSARAYLAARLALRRSTHVAPLTPMFGVGSWTPDREASTSAACPVCGGSVRHDSLICAGCQGVTAANQDLLDRQKHDHESAEARAKANREAVRDAERKAKADYGKACKAAKREGRPRPEPPRGPLPRRATYRFVPPDPAPVLAGRTFASPA